MITEDYANSFIYCTKYNSRIEILIHPHGYFRESVVDSIVYFPNSPGEKYHSVGVTPGLNQPMDVVTRDVLKGRILIVGEATNSSGDYVILETHTTYMPLTGDLSFDLLAYYERVLRALMDIKDSAHKLGMSPHDYVMKIAD